MCKTDCRSTVILQVPFPYRALYGLSARWMRETNLCVWGGKKRFHLAHPVSTAITDTASLQCIPQVQMHKTTQNNRRGRCDKCFATCSYSLPKLIPPRNSGGRTLSSGMIASLLLRVAARLWHTKQNKTDEKLNKIKVNHRFLFFSVASKLPLCLYALLTCDAICSWAVLACLSEAQANQRILNILYLLFSFLKKKNKNLLFPQIASPWGFWPMSSPLHPISSSPPPTSPPPPPVQR